MAQRKNKTLQVKGLTSCPKWLLDKYRQAVNYTCQICNNKEEKIGILQAHRIKRGYKGGLYTVWPVNKKGSNIKMLCNKCHKLVHNKEFT